MSLVLNDIIFNNDLTYSFIISSADRRITIKELDTNKIKYHSTRQKVFKIPYINSTVSYFGLAAFNKNEKWIYLSEWLPKFIDENRSISKNIKDFSFNLRNRLNETINKELLLTNPSGFHLAGYYDNKPDFWHFSNIGTLEAFNYKDFKDKYFEPASHFLQRDYLNVKKYNGLIHQFYRNGDFRLHAIISNDFDNFMNRIFEYPDVNKLNNEESYAKYLKFKFNFIEYCYRVWFKNKIIGKPIDMFLITKDKEIQTIKL